MIKNVATAIAILFGATFSDAAYAAPGWTTASTISQLITVDSNLAVILDNGNNPMSCGSPAWYRLPSTAANFQVIAANLLTAKAQGKSVEVWVSSCDTDGASLITGAWTTN